MAIPKSWNTIYIYDENLKPLKRMKINYPLLDKIEEWNDIPGYNKDEKSARTWGSNIYSSVKVFGDKIYLLLNLPRLEILEINPEGDIVNHFCNEKDFRLMRFSDIDIQKEDGRTVFYIMGYSIADEETEMDEYNVYRLTYKTEVNIKDKKK
jgi:hypothetical protein